MLHGVEKSNKMRDTGYIAKAGICTNETDCPQNERACGNGTFPIGNDACQYWPGHIYVRLLKVKIYEYYVSSNKIILSV